MQILDACNEVGTLATSHAIKKFDTDGSPIQVAGVKLTAKQPVSKIYQTPYSAVEVPRYVYQTAKGGKTYCPLVDTLITEMEKFAKRIKLSKTVKENLVAAQTYFANNRQRLTLHTTSQKVCR